MTKIAIIGAGITGLSLGWYLKKYGPKDLEIAIFESSKQAGGQIRTLKKEGYLFEQGPHSWRAETLGSPLMSLIDELGLATEVLKASPHAKNRYLYFEQKLQRLPTSVLSLLLSPFKGLMFKGLWRDLTACKSNVDDESIYNFICRRLGKDVAEVFFDPLAKGIFAGNIHKLSMEAVFPTLKSYEQAYGSLIGGMLAGFRKKSTQAPTCICTLKGGMQSLTDTLANHLKDSLHLAQAVEGLAFSKDRATLKLSSGKIFLADQVFATLPAFKLARLLKGKASKAVKLLLNIPSKSLTVINVAYKEPVLKHPGFGYLVPSREKEPILGVIFASSVFPGQSKSSSETRLTVMMEGAYAGSLSEQAAVNIALNSLKKHLGIKHSPDAIAVKSMSHGIPQYLVGHRARLKIIEAELKKVAPKMHILGNSFFGVSLGDCVRCAEQMALRAFFK